VLVDVTEAGQAARYRDLVRLLLRYGRSDLVSGAGLDEFNADDEAPQGDGATAARFVDDLERMGPTWIKLGQLLSTRYDLLPPAYTDALSRLQDDVVPFPFEEVRSIVEDQLGARLRHLFVSFDETPLAAASLGQVHRARTRSGREVVVKVQRPRVREIVRQDMSVLTRLAEFADAHSEAGRRFGFEQLLTQFRRSLAGELDYTREARNLVTFGELTATYDRIVVPQPLMDYTTSMVLTMEFLPGRKVTDVGDLGLLDVDSGPLTEQLFQCYLRMILDEGVLHADPHPGNILLTDDGRLALLDLGMVASIPQRLQEDVVKLLLALSDGDGEEAARILARMGHPLEDYDAGRFRDEVTHLVSSALATGGGELEAGAVMVELSRVSGQHGLRPPAEMAMIGKALLNLDQTTTHLDPSFSPTDAIRSNLGSIMRGGLKTSRGGVLAAALEAKEFTAQLPRRANRILDAVADGELTVRVDALDEERFLSVLQRLTNRLTIGLVIAAMIVGAALTMQVPTDSRILGYPAIAMVFFVLAAVGGGILVVRIALTDRKVARHVRRQDRLGR
jgi:ubiquinone biosynthesis protein